MDKVIQQVDQKLQGQVGQTKKITGIDAIYGQLSSTNRQVDKLLSRMRHHVQSIPNKKQQNLSKMESPKKKDNIIGKYNYYGKKYRFQVKQQQLNIQPPKVQRQCVSQINFQTKTKHIDNISPKTEKKINFTNNATINQSVFFDDGQIKMPSHQYYIYFDQPQIKNFSKNMSKQKNKKKLNQTFNQLKSEQLLPQKFKPAWLMQKKINSLNRQIKEMKDRQKKRMQIDFNQTKKMRNTFDGPIRIKSNIEKMVQSLWR